MVHKHGAQALAILSLVFHVAIYTAVVGGVIYLFRQIFVPGYKEREKKEREIIDQNRWRDGSLYQYYKSLGKSNEEIQELARTSTFDPWAFEPKALPGG